MTTVSAVRHVGYCLRSATRYPRLAIKGAREFRSGLGMTYGIYEMQEAYDAGRELLHIVTCRRYETGE